MDTGTINGSIDQITAYMWAIFPRIVLVAVVLGIIALIWQDLSVGISLKRVVMTVVIAIVAVPFVTALLALVPAIAAG